ncbi:MAG: (2Fe-2S)-binding protein [Planctomycetes bacterium]|nr:(2Fe-2S)-binding protein [Planctomycetota bacterium]
MSAAQTAAQAAKRVRITVDGKEVQVAADRPILHGMLEAGVEVPHFCYHPGLSIAGNCRMCLVKVKGLPKLQVSCNTFPKEGMEVVSGDEEVARARRAVMEFLLINHPLDCPVCDQAGECWLQDSAYRHGRDVGRFREEKVHKHKKQMGDLSDVLLWGERCIACSRCVRFCEEITGTGEISLVGRGDRVVVDVHPSRPLTNPLAGNVVDVCPVGALVSKDFLYGARVWFMDFADSICPACSKGCNIRVESHQGAVKRLRPRTNLDVNGYWMCDHGRFDFKYVAEEGRLDRAWARDGDRVNYPGYAEALEKAARGLAEVGREFGDGALAALADLWMTNEELLVFRDLAARLGAKEVGVLAGPLKEDEVFPGFTILGDKNPNREGARRILGAAAVDGGLARVVSGIASGKVKGLYLHCGIPRFDPPEGFARLLATSEFLVVHATHRSVLTDLAHIGIPGATSFEKSGTFTNAKGLTQRIRKAVAPPGEVEADLAALQRLVAAIGGPAVAAFEPLSDRAIQRRLASQVEGFAGLDPAALDRPGRGPNFLPNPFPGGPRAGGVFPA